MFSEADFVLFSSYINRCFKGDDARYVSLCETFYLSLYSITVRIHIIKKQTIENYISRNSQSRVPFHNWLHKVNDSDWNMPVDLISTFNNADILGKETKRVVFNIGGNKYRMICKYSFGRKRVHLYINWIGTHDEYTTLCSMNKQYSINKY